MISLLRRQVTCSIENYRKNVLDSGVAGNLLFIMCSSFCFLIFFDPFCHRVHIFIFSSLKLWLFLSCFTVHLPSHALYAFIHDKFLLYESLNDCNRVTHHLRLYFPHRYISMTYLVLANSVQMCNDIWLYVFYFWSFN